MRKFWLVLVCAFMVSTSLLAKTIVVVRHAERTMGDDLSAKGLARSQVLKNMLASESVALVLSTRFVRTSKTVKVLAESQHRDIDYYDSTEELVQKVIGSDAETVVVVGHSNTVPEIVTRLSGVQVPEIGELEFDRFYVISRHPCEGQPRVQDESCAKLLKLKYFVD